MGVERSVTDVAARIRAALEEHARSGGTLPALLAELKRLLHDLPPEETERLREVLAALRAVGRAWSQEAAGEATLSLEVERGVHDALAELRRAAERID